MALAAGAFLLGIAAVPGLAQEAAGPVLARVEVRGSLISFPLPVHAHLCDKAGREYLLAYATVAQLKQVGWPGPSRWR
jgi:hypothetical protein